MKKRKPIATLKSVEEIPDFCSEQAEAEFWQTHSPVEIFDQLPSAEDVHFHRPSKRLIPLPLSENLYEEIRRQAHKQGVSPLALIQQWVSGVENGAAVNTDSQ